MAIEYEVIDGMDKILGGTKLFSDTVQGYLNDGWKLAGGVSVTFEKDLERVVLYQAVYRETDSLLTP